MNLFRPLKDWIAGTAGVAAMEFALVTPAMAIMLIGLVDLGNGILVNQKAVNAAQVVSSILTRDADVTVAEIDDAVSAAALVLRPYSDRLNVDVHVVSMRFTDVNEDEEAETEVVWERHTGQWEIPSPSPEDRAKSLAVPGEGIVLVGIRVEYPPIMAGSILGTLDIQALTFVRGRQSATVSCPDCPTVPNDEGEEEGG